MRKVIDRILKDENYFNQKKMTLSFSCEEINEEVEVGKSVQGSFRIHLEQKNIDINSEHDGQSNLPVGFVYSHDMRMLVERSEFSGTNVVIPFRFDSNGLPEGSIIEGRFAIVSNMGEYELPYRIQVKKTVPGSSLGEIRNLFHFANLAKSDWNEAKKLFYSDRFYSILDQGEKENDQEAAMFYKSLSFRAVRKQVSFDTAEMLDAEDEIAIDYTNQNSDQNMENFLILTRKKNRITYATDICSVVMKAPRESIRQSFRIVREGWGYTNLRIRTEGEFLSIKKDVLLEEDFAGNVCEVFYVIYKDRLYLGQNTGRIILEDTYTHIEIPITVEKEIDHAKAEEEYKEHYQGRENTVALVSAYLNFRTGKRNKNQWLKESGEIVRKMLSDKPDDLVTLLYQAQLLLSDDQVEEAKPLLFKIEDRLNQIAINTKKKMELTAYYYYLCSMASDNQEEIREYAEKAELLYVKNVKSWRLAWVLLYLKEEFLINDQKKWDFIKRQYSYGNASPMLFVEALQMVMKTPSVMQDLTDFELAFMHFVIKQNVLTREIRSRFVFLAPKMRAFSKEVYDILRVCYEKEDKDETLQEICVQLMKGNKIGQEYFEWYERAVEKELRINRLYEYYIMSIDLAYEGRLPKIVLMYFAYRSNLDYERNAFLYANVLKHKNEYQDIYTDYLPHIEKFVSEQILKGRVNDNLAYLYEEIMAPLVREQEYADAYMNLYFMHQLKLCTDHEFVSVVVTTAGRKEDEVYPIYQKEALIGLAGTGYVIALEDAEGNRYIDDELYSLEPVLESKLLLTSVVQNSGISLRKAFYLAEDAGEQIYVSEKNEEELSWLSKQEEITEKYRVELILHLADYYFEKDEIVKLDELIQRFDPAVLSGKERETCIRIMVARGLYEKAMGWIHTYGLEEIDYKILVRLCDRVFVRNDYEYDAENVAICQFIFQLGKYDETILEYLIRYGKGTSQQLKMLWRAADSFGIEVHLLLEKILVQILFSGVSVGEETNIYLEYVKDGSNSDLEKAVLSMLSYKYFNKQEKLDDKVFDRVITLAESGEKVSTCCKLAYLKKTTQIMKNGKLYDAEKKMIPIFLSEMTTKHIFFPFFMEFRRIYPALEMMADRQFIEYRGKEGSRVILHYVVERGEDGTEMADNNMEYKKEEMPHMYAGIYVKSFILFHGDRIQYYITEEDGRQEKLTLSSYIQREDRKAKGQSSETVESAMGSLANKLLGDRNSQNDLSKFDLVNGMVISRQQNDYDSYCRYLQEYSKQNYLVQRLFKTI